MRDLLLAAAAVVSVVAALTVLPAPAARAAVAEDDAATWVLDAAATAPASCTDLHKKLWHALVEDDTSGAVDLQWEIDCGETHADGSTDYAVQIVVEAVSGGAAALADYLGRHQELEFWGTPMAFRAAARLDQGLTLESGYLRDEAAWDVEVLDRSLYRASYPSFAAYHRFYTEMQEAFWFAGVDGFQAFVGRLFGPAFAADYRARVMPASTIVATDTKLVWVLRDGGEVASRMIFDILHDCRARENGHCA